MIFTIELIGTILIIVLGSLFHFLYDWTNHNKVVGYFTAVNESTWEHIKLVIAPSFIWLIVEYHFYFDNPSFFFAKFVGLLVMIIVIPLIFYSYISVFKKDILIIDIGSFVIAVILGQYVFSLLLNVAHSNNLLTHIGIFGLISIFISYMTHTYVPKENFLHKDPLTKKYGIEGHLK